MSEKRSEVSSWIAMLAIRVTLCLFIADLSRLINFNHFPIDNSPWIRIHDAFHPIESNHVYHSCASLSPDTLTHHWASRNVLDLTVLPLIVVIFP